jgi:hypothetical protein
MEALCGGARLIGGEACRDGLLTFEWGQVPSEGQDVPPVAILME